MKTFILEVLLIVACSILGACGTMMIAEDGTVLCLLGGGCCVLALELYAWLKPKCKTP